MRGRLRGVELKDGLLQRNNIGREDAEGERFRGLRGGAVDDLVAVARTLLTSWPAALLPASYSLRRAVFVVAARTAAWIAEMRLSAFARATARVGGAAGAGVVGVGAGVGAAGGSRGW